MNILEEVIRLKSAGYSRSKILEQLNITYSDLVGSEYKIKHINDPPQKPKRPWIRRNLKDRILIRKISTFKSVRKLSQKEINSKQKSRRILQMKMGQFFKNKKEGFQMSTFNVDQLLEKIGDNPKCYLTGKSIDLSKSRTYELDHIVPRSKGGTNDLDNCNIAIKEANRAKGDLLLEEFIDLCKNVIKCHT
jgi:5-methylcytosine-specific restriction endonuclease McrA